MEDSDEMNTDSEDEPVVTPRKNKSRAAKNYKPLRESDGDESEEKDEAETRARVLVSKSKKKPSADLQKSDASKSKKSRAVDLQKNDSSESESEDGISESPQAQKNSIEEIEDNSEAQKNLIEEIEDEQGVAAGDPCGGHESVLDFKSEYVRSFCDPGQMFADAKCMKCNLLLSDHPPTSSAPIHYCPNFETICEAALCHSCFSELNGKTTRRTRRRK